jgi:hypothetical protein
MATAAAVAIFFGTLMRRTLFAGLLFMLLGTAMAADKPAVPQPAVELVSAEFGVFDSSNARELVLDPTEVVPRRVGQRYGWVIELRTPRRSVSVTEYYVLPPPPEEQGKTAPPMDIPVIRRNQVSQRQLVLFEGRIYGEWAIGPGEPPGQRHLQVVIENDLQVDFKYQVK